MTTRFFGSPLREICWSELIGYAFAAFLLGQVLASLGPAFLKSYLRHAAVAAPIGLLVAKDLVHAPDALVRLRNVGKKRGAMLRRVMALLPPELVGMLRVDRLMWKGAWSRILRKPHGQPSQGVPLTYLERGGYSAASAFVLISIFVELPIHVMIGGLLIKDPAELAVLHISGAVAALYTMVWVAGDRWLLGPGQHLIDGDALHLRVGARASGTVPVTAIEHIEAVDQSLATWRRKRGLHRRDTLVVSPFDKPNCVLVLKPEAGVSVLHWQVHKKLPRYVFLYIDRPELLAVWQRRYELRTASPGT